MTTAPATERKGLAGVLGRLKAGKAHGWGVFHLGSWPMLIGGMLMIFSAFLPWVYVTLTQELIGEVFALRGTDGPGVLTLAVGCLAFAGAFVPKRRLAISHAAIPGFLVAGIVTLQAWNIVIASLDTYWGSFLPGMGLVLAAGGAVVLIRATWMMVKHWPAR